MTCMRFRTVRSLVFDKFLPMTLGHSPIFSVYPWVLRRTLRTQGPGHRQKACISYGMLSYLPKLLTEDSMSSEVNETLEAVL